MQAERKRKNRAIVYIDGFNHYYGIRTLNKPELKWLNYQSLAESFIDERTELMAVKLFTAIVKNREQKKRQSIYLDALVACCPKIKITHGHFLKKGSNCKHCNVYNASYEEKKTDVNIACELLADAYEDKFDVAFVVSGDSDLVPPVERIVSRGRHVIIANPPNRMSQELNSRATNSFNINLKRLKKCLLPNVIKTKRKVITQPYAWGGRE